MQHRLLIYTIYIHIKFKLYCPALTEGLSLVVVFSAFSVYFSLHSSLFSCPSCGQALERQKEYFDCIRNERDELRDELADLKGKSRMGEVCPLSAPAQDESLTSALYINNKQIVSMERFWLAAYICFLCISLAMKTLQTLSMTLQ